MIALMKRIILTVACALVLCSCGHESTALPSPSPESTVAAEPSLSVQAVDMQEPTAKPTEKPVEKPTEKSTEKPAEQPVKTPAAQPVETEPPALQEPQEEKCVLSVSCAEILNNMDKLKPEKATLIPEGGVILAETPLELKEGDTAFSVLQRELKRRKIHMEFNYTPVYDSCYIEGIANIYEMDCGGQSGWIYLVNGVTPEVGANKYELAAGDRVEFYYTCGY